MISMLTVQNLALMNQVIAIQNANTVRMMQMGCLRIPIPVEETQEEITLFEEILKYMVIGFGAIIAGTILFLMVR
jgi:hypothetical protein